MSFELGIAQMGRIAVQVPGRLGERESIEDVARYLDKWFDGIVTAHRRMTICNGSRQLPAGR